MPADTNVANEVRITTQRSQRVYITYILRILEGGPDAEGKECTKCDDVTIRGMGRAIQSVVNIAEIIKRRVVGLHQITTIGSETVTDSTEEEKDGKDRKVSVIMIKLSKKPLDKTNIGYQPPLPADQIISQEEAERTRAPRGEGARRGGRGGPRGERRGGDRYGGDRREGGDRRGGRGGDRREGGDRRVGGDRREGGDRRGGRDGPRTERDDRRGGRGGYRDDRDNTGRNDRRRDYDDYAPRGGRGGDAGNRGRPAPRGGRGGAPRGAARGGRPL